MKQSVKRRPRVGSGWSAVEPIDREKHFRVIAVRRPRAPDTAVVVELEALLTRRRRRVPIDELADDARWRPGWRR